MLHTAPKSYSWAQTTALFELEITAKMPVSKHVADAFRKLRNNQLLLLTFRRSWLEIYLGTLYALLMLYTITLLLVDDWSTIGRSSSDMPCYWPHHPCSTTTLHDIIRAGGRVSLACLSIVRTLTSNDVWTGLLSSIHAYHFRICHCHSNAHFRFTINFSVSRSEQVKH